MYVLVHIGAPGGVRSHAFTVLLCGADFHRYITLSASYDMYDVGLQSLERISKDFSPETDFASRGMTTDVFPGRYPYRDTGLKYWGAIHIWVKEYLDVSVKLQYSCTYCCKCG